ncbi:MAG TPA: helix-turn-helix domain-containing protein [Alphaproteobacteria bacterium]|jgi:predicted DNA-binding transcriptional regulator AlpA|nr:helix-turn-helix domain-containing protein [Alphaproteobacteria bacterium]HJO89542.1 helix-turn-helix domain-containing protein [Alphaproteobacteria bacterium]|tara:strand:+ start:2077 stop:2337 length:261 start_codon:yes stop_codon:yes gene_type:complete
MPTDVETQPTDKDGPSDLKTLPDQGDILIAAVQAPQYLGVKTQTLARWRHEGFGPPWVRMGRLVYYRSSDLRAWIESRLRHNTIAA